MCNLWTYANFFDRDGILRELVKCYKEIRVAVTVGEDTLDVSASDALCVQSPLPAQPPEIVVISVKSTESTTGLLKRLKGIRNH